MTHRRLRITILDLVSRGPAKRLYYRLMNANMASIMPQMAAVWCEELGHEVRYLCYTGSEDLIAESREACDVLIVGAFSRAAEIAYAVGNLYRQQGAVTVLGGPHARCYPEHAARHFDYVLGFTDKATLDGVLRDRTRHRPVGLCICAARQPTELPSLEQRWKFVAPTLAKAPVVKIVPAIGSMGCPYTCSFCIDSTVDYRPLAFERMRDDLRFLATKMRRPMVAWHDPNFGVRFDETMAAIEEAVPPGRMRFIAESSLSLLSEPRLKRLQRNGFVGILPGIESWFALGNKSKTGRAAGLDKVHQVAEHVNLILRHVPYVQTNFVLGLDSDQGDEPARLTKRFLDLTPGVFPAFSFLTAYGAAAPLNLEFQQAGRVLPIPFHFLDGNHGMNVRPLHEDWAPFFARAGDLLQDAYAPKRLMRRFSANRGVTTRLLNVIRARSTERGRFQAKMQKLLRENQQVRQFFDGESDVVPDFYRKRLQRHLGPLWDALPEGALTHDPNAYLKAETAKAANARAAE